MSFSENLLEPSQDKFSEIREGLENSELDLDEQNVLLDICYWYGQPEQGYLNLTDVKNHTKHDKTEYGKLCERLEDEGLLETYRNGLTKTYQVKPQLLEFVEEEYGISAKQISRSSRFKAAD